MPNYLRQDAWFVTFRFVEMRRFIGDPFWTSYVLESDTACKIAELYHTGGAHRNRGSEPGQRQKIMSYLRKGEMSGCRHPGGGDGTRTTTDDTTPTGPPSGPEEGEEEVDHAEAGGRGAGDPRKARAASATGTAAARRQGGGAWAAGAAVQPEDQRGHRKGGGGHPVAAGVPGIWADAGVGISGQQTRHRGEPGDGTAVDDKGEAVAARKTAGG